MFLALVLTACTRSEPTPAPAPLPAPTLWTPARASSWVPAPTRTLAADAAALSPDGTRLYEARGDTLREVESATGAEIGTWTLGLGREAVDVGVSPDGARVAVTTVKGDVAVVSVDTSEAPSARRVVDPPRAGHHGEGGFEAEEVTVTEGGRVRLRNWDGWYETEPAIPAAPETILDHNVRQALKAEQSRSDRERHAAATRAVATPALAPRPYAYGLVAAGEARAAWLAADLRGATAAERSADGRWLLVRTGRSTRPRWLLRGPLDGTEAAPGPPVTLAGRGWQGHDAAPTGLLALHPAGRWLAVGHDTGVAAWDLTTGEPRWLELPGGYVPDALAWSPTGDRLAVLTSPRGPDRLETLVQIHDVDASGAPEATPRTSRRVYSVGEHNESRTMAVTSADDVFVAIGGRSPKLVSSPAEDRGDSWSGEEPDRGTSSFAPAVAVSPDGAWVAWRAGEDRIQVRPIATPQAVSHAPTLETSGSDVILGLADGQLLARSDAERIVYTLADRTLERTPVEGRARGATRGRVRARVAAADLGHPLRELASDALRLPRRSGGREAAEPLASADGTFAWADEEGRVWVATDDGRAPRLLTGPARTPVRVSFLSDRVQVWRGGADTVATFPVDGGLATMSTQEEARAAGGATGADWVRTFDKAGRFLFTPPNAAPIPLPGEVTWLASNPDGTLGAYADAAGVVYLHRAGEPSPFRALLDQPPPTR